MSKSPRLYLLIIGLWAVVLGLAVPAMVHQVRLAAQAGTHLAVLATASALFIAYFWLNGTKDIVYTLHYHLRDRRSTERAVPRRLHSPWTPRVVLVYCTCDDFSADSLLRSMQQRYANFETVILDDSRQPAYLAAVDAFAAAHGVRVVRRPDRTGFKAGNLNNYLRTADFDYFVILDSDEIIPPDFVDRSLDYFVHLPNVGIVQANHRATRNRTAFMRTFAAGVDSHWIAYQTVKHSYGFLSLLGHGAMVSRDCYQAADGFPSVVAEDLCFSIAARDVGFYTAFAPDICCEEEFPVNYGAFKKRHSKWTQGNMEFIKRYTGVILRSRMTWFEKLDIVLFTYSLPLTAFFSLYVAIHVVALPALGYSIVYPLWMLVPTIAFLIAPMLNDVIFHWRQMSLRELLSYLGHSIVLYGSMFFISLRSSLSSMFGKSTFVVTPKEDERVSLRQALWASRGELLFGVLLSGVAVWLTGSILPVLLIVGPALLGFSLALKRTSHSDARLGQHPTPPAPRRPGGGHRAATPPAGTPAAGTPAGPTTGPAVLTGRP